MDENKKLYVHVKIWKQRRLYGEVLAYGPVKVHCRECYRWHSVIIRQPGQAMLQEELVAPEEAKDDGSTLETPDTVQ